MGSRSKRSGKDMNAEQRVGGGQLRQAIYGRDSIGLKMNEKDRKALLRAGGENITSGNKKAKKKKPAKSAKKSDKRMPTRLELDRIGTNEDGDSIIQKKKK